VPAETVQRAVGLVVLAVGVMTLGTLLYAFLETGSQGHPATPGLFLQHMFEAVSAFNTVGLSLGVTPELSNPSRLLTVLLMFVGRVGPLTFATAVALGRPRPGDDSRYAYEDVVIG
jgi:trk system potassium uptake protein TrkH